MPDVFCGCCQFLQEKCAHLFESRLRWRFKAKNEHGLCVRCSNQAPRVTQVDAHTIDIGDGSAGGEPRLGRSNKSEFFFFITVKRINFFMYNQSDKNPLILFYVSIGVPMRAHQSY